MRLLHVVGARPNFMKIAPVWRAIAAHTPFSQILVHTGQHYDVNMSDVFFTDLNLPAPDYYLGVGSGSHAVQTAAVMVAFEKTVQETEPDWVLVYGDVNSTVAASLVCAKLLLPVAHVEAGLRSFDRTMPEEINRILTDQIADLLFTPSPDGDAHLLREGVPAHKIHRVGNVMIDSLVRLLPRCESSTVLDDLDVAPQSYAVLTLHRPANVDDPATLRALLLALAELSETLPIIFPIHPRTHKQVDALDLSLPDDRFRLSEPLGYMDFMRLMSQSRLVLTDSGGIQEETSYLRIPCITLRPNTERPITVEAGTNVLVGNDVNSLRKHFLSAIQDYNRNQVVPIPLWDGKAGERIAEVFRSL